MPTSAALRVCPDLILLEHTSGLYSRVSARMFELCETLTPIVQRNSIDEGYLDLAPRGPRDAAELEELVRGLQRRIWEELAIPVSMGLATNKLVAQIASKLRKPRGFVVVPAGTEAEFLAPLDVGRLPGVGKKTEEMLQARGVILIRDVLARGERELESLFGRGWPAMVAAARGEDDAPVETERDDAKSYSQQETFSADIADTATIVRIAKGMIDALLPQIRADGKRVRTLTIKVRYGDFTHESAGRSLEQASDLEAPFYPLVEPLLRKAWSRRRALRLVSVRLSGVEDAAAARQLDLFSAEAEAKKRRLADVLDRLNSGKAGPRVRHGHQIGGGTKPET
jgi:DNA polymerase-4